jgi:hypothetical protein
VVSAPALIAVAAIEQVAALQKKPFRQSASAEQLSWHAPAEQMKLFLHGCACGLTHFPLLPHVPTSTKAVPEHEAEPQLPVGKLQAPEPSQEPVQPGSPPQAEWFMCGAALAEMFVQVPRWPAMSQATHEPLQSVSQQYPSGEQLVPEMHPAATVAQVCPCLLLQAPVESQVPAQRPLGSSMLLAAAQVWLLVSHAMHVPVQSLFVQQPEEAMQTVVLPLVHDLVVEPLHE